MMQQIKVRRLSEIKTDAHGGVPLKNKEQKSLPVFDIVKFKI